MNHTPNTVSLRNVVCVLTALPTGSSPIFHTLLRLPYCLRYNIEIRSIYNPTMAYRCSSERKTLTFLILDQKLAMIKHSEEGMSKPKIAEN